MADELIEQVEVSQEIDEKTIDQKIKEIGQELLATSFVFTERSQRGEAISKEDEEKYKNTKKWFGELEKIYAKMKSIRNVKVGKVEDEDGDKFSEEAFDQEVIEKIKKKKSMLKDIRQDLK